MLERVAEELAEDERERRRAAAGERDAFEPGLHRLARGESLHEHRAQALDQLVEVDVVLAVLRQHLVHGGDREDPVDGVGQRLARVDGVCARLQPQERGDRLEVVLDPVMDLLGEDAAHHGPAVLERDGGVVGDRLEQLAVVGRERRVAVADELTDHPPLPAQRQPHGVLSRAPLRPGDPAVVEHERGARGVDGGDRRLHDRLERLLEVEGLGDGLGDARERLELVHAPLRLRVELGVRDRLRHLRGDRCEQVDLRLRPLARRPRPHVQRPLERVPRQDRHGEDRLVLVLAQVGELLEARVEVGVRGDRDRRPVGCRRARDPLTGPEARPPRHLLDPRAVRRPEHELVGALVVEVDEACVGAEGISHLGGDERQHLLEVERRVHRGDRLGEQAQVPRGGVHPPILGPGAGETAGPGD